MSVYCTVQEAWGQNFGRRQINNGSEQRQNDNDSNTIENFADIDPMPNSERMFTKAGARVYQPDDTYHHSSATYRQFKASTQQPKNNYFLQGRNVPKSYETNSSQGSDYYDFEDNKCPLGGSRIRSNDVLGEPQLNDEMYPVYPGNTYSRKRVDCNPITSESNNAQGKINAGCDQTLCDDITLHIMNCPTCQKSVTKIVEKFRSAEKGIKERFDGKTKIRNSRGEYDDYDNETTEDDDTDEGSLNITEIILFIICGIFFVFLLDSIVSIGKRFK